MNKAAIFHRSSGNFCYASDKDTVVVRLQTGKDVDSAAIICEDPFINELKRKRIWFGVSAPMKLIAETEEHFLWEYRTKPPYKRLQYYFSVISDGQEYEVYDNKVSLKTESEHSVCQYFKFPWLNVSDVIAPPEWVKHTVWYQIMPDRFCRAKASPEKDGLIPWGHYQKTGFNHIYGGNLKGITERLPYLHDLGISGLYLTPVFQSPSYHKYNTFDYRRIDSDLGTEEDMKTLVSTAHSLGIKVMLDGVFNHCGTEFFAWKDVCEKKKDSPYYEWFFINDDDFLKERYDTADGRYYTFSFWAGMPKLNTNNPEVMAYFGDICAYWIREWDIDGIRFDVGDEISHSFLQYLNRTLKPLKPELFLLGEIWFDSLKWLCQKEYDSVMNYPLSSCINDIDRHSHLSAKAFQMSLDHCLTMYPEQSVEVMFNFLDTHDTVRIAEECKGDHALLLQKLALLFAVPGTPCLYYGTEIALRGETKDDNRHCMPWDKIENGVYDEILSKVRKLIDIRCLYPQLHSRSFRFLFDEQHPRLIHFLRDSDSLPHPVGIILNTGYNAVNTAFQGRILFSEGFENGSLLPKGTVIYESETL